MKFCNVFSFLLASSLGSLGVKADVIPPPTDPVHAPAPPVPIDPTAGCCSYDFKTCVTWEGCVASESQCLACGPKSDPTTWLTNGALTGSTCLAKWNGYGCTSDSVCCPGLACVPDANGDKACLPPVGTPTPPVPTDPAPGPTPPVPTAPVHIPTAPVSAAPVPAPTPPVPAPSAPVPIHPVPTAPVPAPTPPVPAPSAPVPIHPVPTAPVPAPTPPVPAPSAPVPIHPVPTAPVPVPTHPTAPVPAPTSTKAIPLWGRCGTSLFGDLGVNCISSYCAWTTFYKSTCQPCHRAPLNSFDCKNYKLTCGTARFTYCAKYRKLRGMTEEEAIE